MKHKSNWDYYGVKIIKQLVVEGKPDSTLVDDLYEDDGKQMYEESVMLVHAQSYEHAYKVARRKAKEAEKFSMNGYGQQAIWRLVDTVDCFYIFDKPQSGSEVYACFHITEDSTKDFMNKWFSKTDGE